ncbi:energy transducer TonB [Methylocapsa acidiphila]|uniref:energy transducer TonB n=1 Tax=Methylocapsa acidiphila TaxID=133552 RepID=UPI00040D83EA|nr:TonB family protein [Methylocapsa acidiphila]
MGKIKFTIYHGVAASFLLHSALSVPIAVYGLAREQDEPTLVVELRGAVAEVQVEQKLQQQTSTQARPVADEQAKTTEDTPEKTAAPDQPEELKPDDDDAATPPPAPQTPQTPPVEAKTGNPGASNTPGADEAQKAQIIRKARDEEMNLLKAYVKALRKKVQTNLVYPDEGRARGLQGEATVSFTVLESGQIREGTLKIVASSGQAQLDSSALKTIRSSAPFDAPPRQMTVVIDVGYGRKHR